MFASGDTAHGLHERRPRFPLLGKYPAPFSRHLVEPAAPLAGLFDPGALEPSALLEAIEQRIERIDVERQLAVGPCVDQLTQLVAVPGPRVEQRQDEQLRGASLQLAIECTCVNTCHRQILCRQAFQVNLRGEFGADRSSPLARVTSSSSGQRRVPLAQAAGARMRLETGYIQGEVVQLGWWS